MGDRYNISALSLSKSSTGETAARVGARRGFLIFFWRGFIFIFALPIFLILILFGGNRQVPGLATGAVVDRT